MKKDIIVKKKQVVKPVSIALTEDEKNIIKEAAKKHGTSFSDFVRQSALHVAQA